MKCTVPEISWHNRDPVYSVDFQPKTNRNEDFYRLASGGTDSHVVIWYVRTGDKDKATTIEFASDLQRHQRAVNIVRFSPNGEILASGDDEAVIILWKLKGEQDHELPPINGKEEVADKETWISYRTLRKHLEDVYDLCWSPDSCSMISGSIDNTAIVWDIEKGRTTGILGEHKGFVQGVAWDPKKKYVATLSTDRTFRVFNVETRKQVAKVFKLKPAVSSQNTEGKEKEDKGLKLFHDDTLKSFFRRLCFSPDGELIITPCGLVEEETVGGKPMDATFIFTRSSLNKPVVYLPSPNQYSVAVRCCPILFELRENVESVFALPYRIVFAVATKSTVVLYDTQQLQPFGYVSNIHYTGLTDLTWSGDGRMLIISSSEGYCSMITFDENELGLVYKVKSDEVPTKTDEAMDTPNVQTPDKRSNITCVPDKLSNKSDASDKDSTSDTENKTDFPRNDIELKEKSPVMPEQNEDKNDPVGIQTTPKKNRTTPDQTGKNDMEVDAEDADKRSISCVPDKQINKCDGNDKDSTLDTENKPDLPRINVEMVTEKKSLLMPDQNEDKIEPGSIETTPKKNKTTPDKIGRNDMEIDAEEKKSTDKGDNKINLDVKDKSGSSCYIVAETTPKKTRPVSDDNLFKSPTRIPIRTPEKSGYKTPEKQEEGDDRSPLTAELSLDIEGDEEELISKIEQARRLIAMSPSSKHSPSTKVDSSPCRTSDDPNTRKGRRVNFITLSSPKQKKKC